MAAINNHSSVHHSTSAKPSSPLVRLPLPPLPLYSAALRLPRFVDFGQSDFGFPEGQSGAGGLPVSSWNWFASWSAAAGDRIHCAGIKAVATPDSALELPLTAENVERACGSCPSAEMTMKMGIERRLMEKFPEVVAVEAVPDEETGLELNEENIEKVLEEIRPFLVGAAGGDLELVAIEEPIVKVRITGPAAGVMTVRVAVTQKLREKIPSIAAVQLLS
ncbi:UNVERIFIED_CONTAM: NifU-like protein 2, chloroplastic [Sesamum calycinum]|uniref:NifU-like protein 2, chloroplastic n=1 Tax=Sesamum calycinum TaxID=2727403 RepID=A0AAW2PQK0_9LAMI